MEPAQARADRLVETAGGRLRGVVRQGVQVFRGVPYAASTAGPHRFLPPRPAPPWSGVRDALHPSPSAPQPLGVMSPLLDWYSALEPLSEDCLGLDIYAPANLGGRQLPVMVWLHGGAWWVCAGTAPGLDATELARRGEVVVVSLNHRLNLFGYLRLDDPAERFADSGNAGVLDMIAALEWVQGNIAGFGGDPGNVTIFGQSGGGSKVACLMAAPAARGLFHKAIVQSASGCLKLMPVEAAERAAAALAAHLGIGRPTGEALQQVPMMRLVEAMAASGFPFRPVRDGRTFADDPFAANAPVAPAAVPLMAGTTATETWHALEAGGHENFALELAEVSRRLARFLRIEEAHAATIIAAYREEYPADNPAEVLARATSDYIYTRNTREVAIRQAAVAPCHVYRFDWETPILGGRLHSPHAVELPFIFGTTRAAAGYVGTGPQLEPMTRMMIAAWSAFAHTGSPNNPLLPSWPCFDRQNRTVMILNTQSEARTDPGAAALAALDDLPFYDYAMPSSFVRP